jgi:acetyl-CoA carboxylase alpha subunit
MATTRFQSTIAAIKKGAKSLTIEQAVNNIEGWEDYLGEQDHEGAKKVVQDLGKLKKLLHAKEPDGEAIKTLVQKLGKETIAIAGDEGSATANHIKELGEALSKAA